MVLLWFKVSHRQVDIETAENIDLRISGHRSGIWMQDL